MPDFVTYITLALLLVVNAGAVLLVVFQLPGTWFMVLVTGLCWKWYPGEDPSIHGGVVIALVCLAALGEFLEFSTSARGARKAGGSKRGAIAALLGGGAGAILGTIPRPVVGPLIGACVGAGLGSYLGDRWAGRSHQAATDAGKGAAVGRLWGTVAKLTIAVAMWLITAVAVFRALAV